MGASARTIEREEARLRVENACRGTNPELKVPKLGWIRTLRTALGMSAAALARRMNRSRVAATRMEQAEVSGNITLISLQAAAKAMNCRLVYTLVPENAEFVDSLVREQAEHKAKKMIAAVSSHMALERQSLKQSATQAEIRRLTNELIQRMPRDLWDE
jgi:predicted DNA-binding mobile mystery protein A